MADQKLQVVDPPQPGWNVVTTLVEEDAVIPFKNAPEIDRVTELMPAMRKHGARPVVSAHKVMVPIDSKEDGRSVGFRNA